MGAKPAPELQEEAVGEVAVPENPISPSPSIFEGMDIPENTSPPVVMEPVEVIPADLSESEREEFVRLLNEAIGLRERAQKLAHLARMKGSKTAAVGLRALQEINSLTGVSRQGPTAAPALFQLPKGMKVSIEIKKDNK